ncbi:Guanylate cyclase 32E [Eumeta japonica]|uniref:Guanylate cyclase 32E n=1 Tax=Eumeta variegata TaxID=151549 RepID=A0A4C1VKI2_EUMVA|nr:Guanylate cyclase 32E [Eumeta japonica]
MDPAGDAEGNFTVVGLVPDAAAPGGWRARPVAAFRYTSTTDLLPELVGGKEIAWIGGKPPVAEPPCGFDGVKCALPHDPGVISAAAAVAAAAVLAAALLLRHYRYEQKLASVLWRIEAKDLTFIPAYNTQSGDKWSAPAEAEQRRAHTTIALYRGNVVAVKRLHKKSIDVTRAIRKELKQATLQRQPVKAIIIILSSDVDVEEDQTFNDENVLAAVVKAGNCRIGVVTVYFERDMLLERYLDNVPHVYSKLETDRIILEGDINAWSIWWGRQQTQCCAWYYLCNFYNVEGLHIPNERNTPTLEVYRVTTPSRMW